MKRQLSHLYKSVLPGLCLPLANNLVFFTTPDLLWDPPLGAHAPLSQDGFQKVKASGSKIHYALALFSDF